VERRILDSDSKIRIFFGFLAGERKDSNLYLRDLNLFWDSFFLNNLPVFCILVAFLSVKLLHYQFHITCLLFKLVSFFTKKDSDSERLKTESESESFSKSLKYSVESES
jgi:hypothetical protein